MTPKPESLSDRLYGALAEIAESAPPVDMDALRGIHCSTPSRRSIGIVAASTVVAVALVVALPIFVFLANGRDVSAPPVGESVSDNRSGGSTEHSEMVNGPSDDVDQVSGLLMAFDEQPGFGRVIVDYDHSVVTLLWKGTVPADVREAISHGPSTVTIETRSTLYSAADLAEAGTRILRASRAGRWQTAVVDVIPTQDLSGVIVRAREPDAIPVGDVARVGGVPVQLRSSGPVVEGR